MSEIRRRAIQGIKEKDTFTVERTFTEKDVRGFAHSTRDYNPVHFDERFAAAKDLKGRICHGLLVAGMITQIGGQVGWLASHFDLHFKRPVYMGDTITCTLTVNDIDEKGRARATAEYVNQEGIVVLRAFLEGVLPGPEEQKILRKMVEEGDPTNPLASEP